MSAERFGTRCDGPGSDPSGCSVFSFDQEEPKTIFCGDCCEDFCASCCKLTGHWQIGWPDSGEGGRLACVDESADYINDPSQNWLIGAGVR